jgi:hypothetical protein
MRPNPAVEVLRMMFSAANEAHAGPPPTLLSVRRWLKVLVDRSLVLGSVDKPSLHGASIYRRVC